MKTESTSVDEPSAVETLSYKCRLGDENTPPHGNPTFSGDPDVISIPGFSVEYEEHTPNSDGLGRHGWQSYEHYLCRRDRRPNGLSSVPFHLSLTPGWPHAAVAEVRNSRFGITPDPSSLQDNPFGEPGFPVAGLLNFYEKRGDDGFIPEPLGINLLEQTALSTVLPGIKAELSLINSLIELKDFSSLPKTIAKVAHVLEEIPPLYKRLRDITKTSADGYLQAKFNILPLLSDISGIHAALSSAEKRIAALVAGAGKPRTRHWTKSISERPDPQPEITPDYLAFNRAGCLTMFRFERTVKSEPSIFHVQIQYNYLFTEYQTVHAQLLGLLDAFGVNLNPSIIWNALPWSFVVDWVFGVGRFLDNLKVRNLEPQINIRRYLWSIRRERRIWTNRIWNPIYPEEFPIAGSAMPCPMTLEVGYRRQVKSPSISSIALSGLNPNEISLGAALVISRKRRPRNRVRKFF
jgi:hypothetical protein